MAKTAAEGKKEYQASRQLVEENGERRVSAYVSTRAALALKHLANSYCVTKRELLEKLLIAEDEKVLKGLNFDISEGRKYLGELD